VFSCRQAARNSVSIAVSVFFWLYGLLLVFDRHILHDIRIVAFYYFYFYFIFSWVIVSFLDVIIQFTMCTWMWCFYIFTFYLSYLCENKWWWWWWWWTALRLTVNSFKSYIWKELEPETRTYRPILMSGLWHCLWPLTPSMNRVKHG